MENAIQLGHVTLRYGEVEALSDVSLSIKKGERICIIGANGSGKSTLASVICGLVAPDAGSVYLADQVCCVDGHVDADAYERARRKIGLVFQNPEDQLISSNVAQDVAFGPENLGWDASKIDSVVKRELKRVALLERADDDPSKLSGGQKQRVAIAGALAMEPDIVVFDEPGALLDVRGRRSILHVMDKLCAAGTTVVHITHFMDETLTADRTLVLDHGKLVEDAKPEVVFSHIDEIENAGLELPFVAQLSRELAQLGCKVEPTLSSDKLKGELIVHIDPTRTPSAGTSTTVSSEQDAKGVPLIRAEHVSFSYNEHGKGHKVLSDITLNVYPGQKVALIGQTGSGKSTLLRLMAALDKPDVGEMSIRGISTATRKGRRKLLGTIGYVMQRPERQLFAETVAQDVAFGPSNLGLRGTALEERVAWALQITGLSHRREASPFELSGGQRRLCAIAGILAMRPDMLLLDEPQAGLDPRGREELASLIERLNSQGTTIVEVTHAMEDVAGFDSVIVLDRARIAFAGAPHQVFAEEHTQDLAKRGLGIPAALSWAYELKSATGTELGMPADAHELALAIAGVWGDAHGL